MVKDPSAVSIIEDLIKGTVTINRMEEFNKVLAEYPDSPFVNRLVADFLKKKFSFPNAIKKYKKTYGLFMKDGETLHAIAALMELWEIVTPVPYDYRSLHSQLRRRETHNSALDECFAAMSYRELRAILTKLEKTRVKTGETVQLPSEPEESLYFVVSGELMKTPLKSDADDDFDVQFMIANDHFGDDHPLEEKGPAPYQIKAASESELLKISKDDFLAICLEYPALKDSLNKLARDQQVPEEKKPEKFLRKTVRHNQIINLRLKIFPPEAGQQPTNVKGYTSDISLGGTRIVVDPKYKAILDDDIKNRKTVLRISLPDESISVLIVGRIAWHKEAKVNGKKTRAVGVQFNETPPRLRAAMIFFINALSSANKDTKHALAQDGIESR